MRDPKNKKTHSPDPAGDHDIVPSMGAAAGVLGCSKEVLKRYKNEGCPAFLPSNRVDLTVLRNWLINSRAKDLEAPPDNTLDLERRDLLAKAETREFHLAVLRGAYVEKQLIAEHLQRLGAEVKQLLRQKENEFPPLAAHQPADAIKPLFVTHITDDILQKVAAHFSTWTI